MSNENVPKMMRAVMYNKPRGTLQLDNTHGVPQPNLGADEHLIRVHSFGITKGELSWQFPEEAYNDYSPGVEACGIVVAGPANSKFTPGSRVYLRITAPRCGAAREYTIALGSEMALQPKNLTPEQAVAVPVSALTAWQALFVQVAYDAKAIDASNTQEANRKRILIIGASGSVGVWATQLARAAGLWVAGTCNTRNLQLVRDMGLHEVIDYTATSVRQWADGRDDSQKFDLVLDCVGGHNTDDAWYAAHPEYGLVLTIVPPPGEELKWTLDRPADVSEKVQGRFFIMDSDGKQLQKITELIEAGKVKPVVDSVFELEDYQKAFDRVESGKTTGKVVVRV